LDTLKVHEKKLCGMWIEYNQLSNIMAIVYMKPTLILEAAFVVYFVVHFGCHVFVTCHFEQYGAVAGSVSSRCWLLCHTL